MSDPKSADFSENQKAMIASLARKEATAISENIATETFNRLLQQKATARAERMRTLLDPTKWSARQTMIGVAVGAAAALLLTFVWKHGYIGTAAKNALHMLADLPTSTRQIIHGMASDKSQEGNPLAQLVERAMTERASMIFQGRSDLGRKRLTSVIDEGCWRTIAWLAEKLKDHPGVHAVQAPLPKADSKQPSDLPVLDTCRAVADVVGTTQLEIPFFARLGRSKNADDEVTIVMRLDWIDQNLLENDKSLDTKVSAKGIPIGELPKQMQDNRLDGLKLSYHSLLTDLGDAQSVDLLKAVGLEQPGFSEFESRFYLVKLNKVLPYDKLPDGSAERFQRYQHTFTVSLDEERLKAMNVGTDYFARVAVYIFVNRAHNK